MIPDEEIDKAVNYLRDSAQGAAHAKAERVYMEAFVKTVLAQEISKDGSKTATERETMARQSQPYLDTLHALREAVEADEKHKFLREAADAKIRAWQTWKASERAGI